MKLLLSLFFFLIHGLILSDEYIMESSSKTNIKELIINNEVSYKSLEIDGRWKDSEGEYGLNKCFGHIKSESNQINLEAYFEKTDSKGDKAWFTNTRKTEMQEAGTGISLYIAATGKYKRLIGIRCPYAVKYYDKEFNFYMHKCKIN